MKNDVQSLFSLGDTTFQEPTQFAKLLSEPLDNIGYDGTHSYQIYLYQCLAAPRLVIVKVKTLTCI